MALTHIHWPQVIVVTIVLYILIIISLPFSEVQATIFLFALIAYWSRLPGVGIINPGNVLYATDFVDFFTFILAVNVGPGKAIIFETFCNLTSRAAGVTPRWAANVKDTIAQAVACLIIPFFFNGNLVSGMLLYSAIRWFMFIPMRFIEPTPRPWPDFFARFLTVQASTYIVNGFYAKYFGPFFDHLLEHGVQFSWPLFIAATIIVLIGKNVFFSNKGIKYLNWRYWIKLILKKITHHKTNKPIISETEDEKIIMEAKSILNPPHPYKPKKFNNRNNKLRKYDKYIMVQGYFKERSPFSRR